MSETRKRVVTVERHPIIRERLAEIVAREADLAFAGEADSLQSGLELIKSTQPDIALVGLTLEGASGLDLIKQVRALSLPTATLVFSGRNESLYAKRVLTDGARGFLSKSCTTPEIVAAIRHVLGGKIYVSPAVAEALLHTVSIRPIAAPIGRSIAHLSDRELEVLEKIGQGKNSQEIAQSLGLGVASVDTYRARIKEKLNLRNAFDLVCFAIRWFYDLE